MRVTDPLRSQSSWMLRAIVWSVALMIIFALVYKVMFQKQAARKEACLDQASSTQQATTASASVEKYAACIAGQSSAAATPVASSKAPAQPVRCRFAGVWAAARGSVVYQVTLEAGGRFEAEPGQNAPANAPVISGAWSVAGNSLVWAYDSGAVWPPDVNPITAESEAAFTLTEVNGSTTRYSLIEPIVSELCAK